MPKKKWRRTLTKASGLVEFAKLQTVTSHQSSHDETIRDLVTYVLNMDNWWASVSLVAASER